MNEVLLQAENVKVYFNAKSNLFSRRAGEGTKAVDGVSLTIGRNEIHGLVGESGSGKSTLGRAIMGLNHVTAGRILFHGQDLAQLRGREMAGIRTRMPFPRFGAESPGRRPSSPSPASARYGWRWSAVWPTPADSWRLWTVAGWSMISWKSWPARAAAPAAAGSPSGTARSWPPFAVPGSGRWMHGRRFGFPMKTPMCRPSTAPI